MILKIFCKSDQIETDNDISSFDLMGSDTEEKTLFRTIFGPKFPLVSFTPSVFKYYDIKIQLYFQIYDIVKEKINKIQRKRILREIVCK
jgi:hypothetical protein